MHQTMTQDAHGPDLPRATKTNEAAPKARVVDEPIGAPNADRGIVPGTTTQHAVIS